MGWSHRVDRVLGFFQVVQIGTLPPPPHPQAVGSPLLWFRGDTLTRGGGGGGVPIRTTGPTLWYSRYIFVFCGRGIGGPGTYFFYLSMGFLL